MHRILTFLREYSECRAKNIEAVLPMFVNFSDVVTVKNRAGPSDSS